MKKRTSKITYMGGVIKNKEKHSFSRNRSNILYIILILIGVISLGFSGALLLSGGTQKSYAVTGGSAVGGSDTISSTDDYLYNIVYDNTVRYAVGQKGSTYTGNHADTVDSSGNAIVGSNAIYYYTKAGYNNVKLGNFCWKIIRTTDTGGVKLIYNGTYSDSTKCNNTGTNTQIGTSKFNETVYMDRKGAGYKYKTSTNNDTDSTIKAYIDNWYRSNMTDYVSQLEDTVFCNDRTGSTSSSSAATGTTWGGDPSTVNFYYHNYPNSGYTGLACDNVKDRFTTNNNNAKLTYPVGLMTKPEYLLSGAASTSHVHYTGGNYWLISPGYLYADPDFGSNNDGTRVSNISYGNMDSMNNVKNSYGVRPVVSLAPGVKTTGTATGTSTDPYEISTSTTFTATFYYQSNATSGSTTVSSVTASCETTSDSCTVTIPSTVRSSVGTYNNSYAGLNTSTGSMSTPVGSSSTTVTLTGDATYYSVYRSSVSNYYYQN